MIAFPRRRRFRQRHPVSGARGFTLLEVLLAVGIAGALLAVALFFYRQATVFRDSVLGEMGRVGAARQVMRRLATELTCLAPEAGALRGTSFDIEFAFASVLSGDPADDGLRRVRYALPEPDLTVDPEAEPGRLQRQETRLTTEDAGEAGTPETDLVTFGSLLAESEEPPPPAGRATIAEVGYFRLRYWDGVEWREDWNAAEPPLGVEVTLGFEPLDPETAPEDYPHEVFRRLIALPVTGPAEVATDGARTGSRDSGRAAAEPEPGDARGGSAEEPPPPGDSGRPSERGRRRG